MLHAGPRLRTVCHCRIAPNCWSRARVFTCRTVQDDDETPKTDEEVVVALQMALNRSTIRPPPLEVEERCRLSKGDWCTQYMLQVGLECRAAGGAARGRGTGVRRYDDKRSRRGR